MYAVTCSMASSRRALQATLDLTLYILFFIPGVFALTWAGYNYAADSWAINEHSNITADGPPIYPFKTIIPLAGAFLLAQGLVEIVRCIICLKQGKWPSRGEDVEEVDVDKLKEMVHVKDEDIAKLDQFVVAAGEHEMKIRKELWFGFSLMAIILAFVVIYTPWCRLRRWASGRNGPGPRPADAGTDRGRHHARVSRRRSP